jgi:hypothetical protein
MLNDAATASFPALQETNRLRNARGAQRRCVREGKFDEANVWALLVSVEQENIELRARLSAVRHAAGQP